MKVVVLLVLLCGTVGAQSAPKIRIMFTCECSDPTGALYATAFRDLLASSPRFRQVFATEEKGTDGKLQSYNWQVRVVSLDPSPNDDGQRTVLSSVLLGGGSYFFTQQVQICGRARASECAQATLSFIDGYLARP